MAHTGAGEVVRRWIEALNRRDFAVAETTFTPDCEIHVTGAPGVLRGPGEFLQFLAPVATAFPDIRFEIHEQIEQDGRAATRWSARVTHTGPFFDAPPSGRAAVITGVAFDRVVDDRIVERWEHWDEMALLRQLGLAPGAPA